MAVLTMAAERRELGMSTDELFEFLSEDAL